MESRIPPELREALTSGLGYLLLIKGEPGTGKTMLAFEILNEFGGKNAAYLSTRISLPAFFQQFPWLKERTDSIAIVDATRLFISARAFPRPRSFSDILQAQLETETELPATLVFDSWETIISEEDKKMTKELEAAIVDAIRHYATEYRMNIILISERTKTTPLDYIVDGIVELSRISVDYRRARQLLLKKLRGVPISQHKYGFTLDGGRFKAFGPFERRQVKKSRSVTVIPPTPTHVSTGVAGIDNILDGGLSRGSTALVQYGDDLSLLGYQSIIAHMIINSIQQETPCVIIPSSGWDERRLRRGILPFVKKQDYLTYFHVFEIRRELKESRENVKVLPGQVLSEEFPVFTEFIAHLTPPVLAFVGLDWLGYQYRLNAMGNLEEALETFSYWITELRKADNIGVFGTFMGCKLGEELGHMVTTRFTLTVLDRGVTLYCNRPDTKLHCLENVITEDTLELQLTPFV